MNILLTRINQTVHFETQNQGVEVGILSGLIRISVGIENVEDIKKDIFQALD